VKFLDIPNNRYHILTFDIPKEVKIEIDLLIFIYI